jgi:hypothetical protein
MYYIGHNDTKSGRKAARAFKTSYPCKQSVSQAPQ